MSAIGTENFNIHADRKKSFGNPIQASRLFVDSWEFLAQGAANTISVIPTSKL